MIKTIQIEPVDEEMELLSKAVFILNEFKKSGYTTRQDFVEYVSETDDSYRNVSGFNKLNNFWAGRVKDKSLNEDLQKILDNIKVA